MRKILTFIILLLCFKASATIDVLNITLFNSSAVDYPGSTSVFNYSMHTSFAPSGYNGFAGGTIIVPPISAHSSVNITISPGAFGNYPTADYVTITMGAPCSLSSGELALSQPGGYNQPATLTSAIYFDLFGCKMTVGTPPDATTTNVTITISNPIDSGLIQNADWFFNGIISDHAHLCPGQSVTHAHLCSIVDPKDTYTATLVPERPSSTNVDGTVFNDQRDKIVFATWRVNGTIVKSEYLMPGQSDTYSQNLSLCTPNVNFTWGYSITGTVPDATNPNNPYGNSTNNTGQYSTGAGAGAGSFSTNLNVGSTTGSFPKDYVFTNNIPYANGLSNLTGLALDATLRASAGQLHDDNLNIIKGGAVLHNDNNDIIAKIASLSKTNPIILNAASNVYVQNFPTNPLPSDYTGLLNSNLFSLNKIYGEFTNQNGQRVQYEAIMTNDVERIISAITNLASTNVVQVNFPTNTYYASSNVWVQNFPSNPPAQNLSNYSTESTLLGISNLLARRSTTNSSNPYNIPDSAKSASSAESAATTAQGDYGVEGLINSITPTLPSESPGAPDMTMSFCGTTIDLDPVHRFPTVANASLIGWRIVLILAFLFEISRMFWKLIEIRASTQTGGVPDLEVIILGEGANLVGVGVAVLIPIAFITIFSVAMAYLFSNLGVSIGEAMNITTWTNSLGSIGYYLLASFFPVNLFFSLLFTRLTLSFTLGKIVALATAAARFLWGK